MGKLDEQLIQLINNEIEGKGGGFEEFCTLASEVVQPVVKKVFPKNETLYKKAVKQILVRMYQKIEMADMNQIQEWMERFALDVLEKNYPRETAAAKKREARPEQETVKNEESLQKSARTEEQEQDELIAAAMAASSTGRPAARPSSTAPMAGPWLSPKMVIEIALPKVFFIVTPRCPAGPAVRSWAACQPASSPGPGT